MHIAQQWTLETRRFPSFHDFFSFPIVFRFFLFCLLSLSSSLVSAHTAKQLSDYYTSVWTTSNGLPHNSINDIAQTTDGYMWFATWEGVVRFNGKDFELFNRSPKTHMADSASRSLFASNNNRLWVGGARGSVAERLGFEWIGQPSSASLVTGMLVDRHHNLWLSIIGKGVYVRHFIAHGQYQPEQMVIEDTNAYGIVEADNGDIYSATDAGVYLYRDGKVGLLPNQPFKHANSVSSKNNQLFVASDNGAWIWNGVRWINIDPQLAQYDLTLVKQDSDGAFWIGTVNHGLLRKQVGRSLESFPASSFLSHHRILSWFQDQDDNIWVGTANGLANIRHAPFINIDSSNGLIGNYVRTALALDDHQLLVGSATGLSLVSRGKASDAVKPSFQDKLSVLALAKDQQGGVWVGTHAHGVMHWQNNQLSPYMSLAQGLPSEEVRAILPDSQGNLWIGTMRGLAKRTPVGKVTIYTKAQGLPGNFIMALAEDETGKIWVGTGVGGAYIEKGVVHSLDLTPLDEAQYVFDFYVEHGFVWMATDRGIIRYRQQDGTLANIGRANGLPIDKFFQFKRQGDKVWLTSNMGVWLLSYQQVVAIADGKEKHLDYQHFDVTDGMGSTQANGGSNPASAVSGERFYVATANGLSFISLHALEQSMSVKTLPVVIENVAADGQIFNPDVQHTIAAGTNRMSFSYIGLSFVSASSLEYQTKLVGFEKQWTHRGRDTYTEYTNLPPGHYEFMVRARYPYQQWNNETAVYAFDIEPLLWQRASVRTGLGLLLILAIYSLMRWRVNQLKRSEENLIHLVGEKTAELREQAERFKQLSNEDALTGLYNRRAFNTQIEKRFKHAKSVHQSIFLAIIDIDHFKAINDTYNHLRGDQVLARVASLLSEHAQSPELVARWGGEEFTVLFKGNEQEATVFFEQLRGKVARVDFSDVCVGLGVTVSIGVASSDDVNHYSSLVIFADEALLKAKCDGRNQVIFHQTHLQAVVSEGETVG